MANFDHFLSNQARNCSFVIPPFGFSPDPNLPSKQGRDRKINGVLLRKISGVILDL